MEIWKRRRKQDKEGGVEKCKIMRIKKLFRFVFSSLTGGGQAGDISTQEKKKGGKRGEGGERRSEEYK